MRFLILLWLTGLAANAQQFAGSRQNIPQSFGSSNITFSAGGSFNNTANQLNYDCTTAVIPANTLAILAIVSSVASSSAAPTNVTGNGCTWVQIDKTNYATAGMTLSVWRTMTNATTATGVQTAAHAATQRGCNMFLSLYTNVDITGANGAGAVVQFKTATNETQTVTVTLAALASSKSATYLAIGNTDNNGSYATPESPGVEDFDNGYNTQASGLYVMHNINTTDNSVQADGAAALNHAAIAIEIKQ
jgi:hypothetical protein